MPTPPLVWLAGALMQIANPHLVWLAGAVSIDSMFTYLSIFNIFMFTYCVFTYRYCSRKVLECEEMKEWLRRSQVLASIHRRTILFDMVSSAAVFFFFFYRNWPFLLVLIFYGIVMTKQCDLSGNENNCLFFLHKNGLFSEACSIFINYSKVWKMYIEYMRFLKFINLGDS